MLARGAAAVNENIEHLYLICEERDKPDVLRKLLHAFELPRSIVFVHRNDVAEQVAAKLAHHKLAVADLNAALDKLDRKQAMDGIRSGAIRIMIASDLAARGLEHPGRDAYLQSRCAHDEQGVPAPGRSHGAGGREGRGGLAAHGNRGPARSPLRAGAGDRHAVCEGSRRARVAGADVSRFTVAQTDTPRRRGLTILLIAVFAWRFES